MKTAAIIQARMGSTRLPGKVLMKILERPLLLLMVERVRRARTIDQIVIATTTGAEDDELASAAASWGLPVFRGNRDDVLDRYYQAAVRHDSAVVVRVTGDCPCIDPGVIDETVAFYLANRDRYDYVANTNPPTYPDGMDTEVLPFSILEQAWNEARLPSEREHVTSYVRKRPEQFRIGNVVAADNRSDLRLTVDEPSDLEVMRRIFERLYPKNPGFSLRDIMDLLDRDPDIVRINAGIQRDEGYAKSLLKDTKPKGPSED